MGHVFEKPSLVVQTAVEILQRQRVLQSLVTTDGIGDFGGSANDTINIRIPAIAGAHSRTLRAADRSLTTDDLVEHTIPVQLTDHVYSAIKLTDEQRTLDISDFARQVVMPQVSAMAYKLEDNIAALTISIRLMCSRRSLMPVGLSTTTTCRIRTVFWLSVPVSRPRS